MILTDTMLHTKFLSTLSLRRATAPWSAWLASCAYFYPRSPCGERRVIGSFFSSPVSISIHALLAESDRCQFLAPDCPSDFYPRSPCGERPYKLFVCRAGVNNFYPRSPCGERRSPEHYRCKGCAISIHALLAESDLLPFAMTITALDFYPRSPCGERPARVAAACALSYFYPRSPCGERLPWP